MPVLPRLNPEAPNPKYLLAHPALQAKLNGSSLPSALNSNFLNLIYPTFLLTQLTSAHLTLPELQGFVPCPSTQLFLSPNQPEPISPHLQGDREKRCQLAVSPLMDRDKNGITKSQVGGVVCGVVGCVEGLRGCGREGLRATCMGCHRS